LKAGTHKTIYGIENFHRWMVKLDRKLKDAQKPLKEYLEEYFLRKTAERFWAEKGPDGKWAPLKRSTQAIRLSLGYPPAHPILKRTGRLMLSVTRPSAVTIRGNEGILASNVDYAAFQQNLVGLKPARPFLYFVKDDLNVLGETFVNWVQEKISETI